MTKRNHYGSGSIIERSDGRLEGRFSVEGKRYSVYGKTKQEVRAEMRKKRQEIESGQEIKSDRRTVGQFLEYWLEVRRFSFEETTHRTQSAYVRLYILPELGHLPLKKLTAEHIQKLYTKLLREKHLKPSTVVQVGRYLKSALNFAVKKKYLLYNPAKDAFTPQSKKREYTVLEPEQIRLFIDILHGQIKCLIVVALATGMRKGELLALHWSNIDFARKLVRIEHTLVYVKGKGLRETDPKTEKSRRTIVLPGFAIDALKQHRIAQLEAKLKAGPAWQENDLVFCTRSGGYIWNSALHKSFKRALHRAALSDMRFHDLRHSAASIFLSMGISMKVVQELLGHSTINTTMDTYGHVLPGMQEQAMIQLDNLLGNAK